MNAQNFNILRTYEYTLKVKNVELDDEALYLLREINTRISLISE